MSSRAEPTSQASALLRRVRHFTGSPKEFWPLFLETCSALTGAPVVWLHARAINGQEGPAVWQRLLLWTTPEGGRSRNLADPAEALLQKAFDAELAEEEGDRPMTAFLVSAGAEGGSGIISLAFPTVADRNQARSTMLLLQEMPGQYLASREAAVARQQNAELLTALDLSLQVDRQRKFLAAAMTVCNELAAQLGCDRASLGWLQENEIIRLRAVSHAEQFERKAQVARALELSMEECLDQETEIHFPGREGGPITRDHAAYARETGAGHLLSLPLRVDGQAAGVFLCERQSAPFDEVMIRRLRVALDQVVRRLADFEEREHWVGRRLWRWLKRGAATYPQPRHTGAKLALALGSAALLFLVGGRLPYRVSAPFVLRSDQVAFVTAPFDGFVSDVAVRVGDSVPAEGLLARFETRELLLQQASGLANVGRHQQEAEKARAANDLAEMRIAQAEAEQAKAALDQTRYHLEKAEIKAPFAGVVVEGDLRKRIGSPFRQGEVLFQLARLDTLSAELEVAERDAHEILDAKTAVIAFASAPERSFNVLIERVHPSAQSRPAGSVFLVQAQLPRATQSWWRPGMTGQATITVGWRNTLWIFTHRTMDWLRLHLWW